MKSLYKSLSASAAMAILAGCNSIPKTEDYEKKGYTEVLNEVKSSKEWLQNPALLRTYSSIGKTITKPSMVPADVRKQPVDLTLEYGATFGDLLTALSMGAGIDILIENDEMVDKKLHLTNFKGTLGGLMDLLSASQGIAFIWEGGAISAQEFATYMISIPQDKDLMDIITDEIQAMGAVEARASVSAGVVYYKASPKRQPDIEKYISRLINNSSLITLQVMAINVNMDRDRKEGFNWGAFQAKLGDLSITTPIGGGDSGDLFSNSETGGGSSSISESGRRLGQSINIGGAGVGLGIAKNSLDMVGLFDMLSTYGEAKTTQDVSLQTLSGKKVTLESAQQIPYVSDVNTSVTDSGFSNSGVETSTAKNGLTMEFMPYYEAENQMVSVDININLETLLGFMELSAGNQLGSITQPRTQVQEFNNTIRIKAGETTILGGVTYESISDNMSSLSMLDKADMANLNKKITTNSLFLLIRPTVVTYELNEEDK